MKLRKRISEAVALALIGGFIVTVSTTFFLLAWSLGHLKKDAYQRKEVV